MRLKGLHYAHLHFPSHTLSPFAMLMYRIPSHVSLRLRCPDTRPAAPTPWLSSEPVLETFEVDVGNIHSI